MAVPLDTTNPPSATDGFAVGLAVNSALNLLLQPKSAPYSSTSKIMVLAWSSCQLCRFLDDVNRWSSRPSWFALPCFARAFELIYRSLLIYLTLARTLEFTKHPCRMKLWIGGGASIAYAACALVFETAYYARTTCVGTLVPCQTWGGVSLVRTMRASTVIFYGAVVVGANFYFVLRFYASYRKRFGRKAVYRPRSLFLIILYCCTITTVLTELNTVLLNYIDFRCRSIFYFTDSLSIMLLYEHGMTVPEVMHNTCIRKCPSSWSRLFTEVHKLKGEVDATRANKSVMIDFIFQELKNPLNVAVNIADMLLECHKTSNGKVMNADFADVVVDSLQTIKNNAQCALALLSDVCEMETYDYASITPEEHPVALDRLFNEIFKRLRGDVQEENATLSFNVDPQILRLIIMCDETRFVQVFVYMVNTGIAHSKREDGTEISVNVRCCKKWKSRSSDRGVAVTDPYGFRAGAKAPRGTSSWIGIEIELSYDGDPIVMGSKASTSTKEEHSSGFALTPDTSPHQGYLSGVHLQVLDHVVRHMGGHVRYHCSSIVAVLSFVVVAERDASSDVESRSMFRKNGSAAADSSSTAAERGLGVGWSSCDLMSSHVSIIAEPVPEGDTPLIRRRILTVDDVAMHRKILIRMLRTLRPISDGAVIEVEEVEDGEQAIRRITNPDGPPIDLVFMDVLMPHLNGLDACRQLRNSGFDLPIIFMTGNRIGNRDALESEALKAGGNQLLAKPFTKADLEQILTQYHI